MLQRFLLPRDYLLMTRIPRKLLYRKIKVYQCWRWSGRLSLIDVYVLLKSPVPDIGRQHSSNIQKYTNNGMAKSPPSNDPKVSVVVRPGDKLHNKPAESSPSSVGTTLRSGNCQLFVLAVIAASMAHLLTWRNVNTQVFSRGPVVMKGYVIAESVVLWNHCTKLWF